MHFLCERVAMARASVIVLTLIVGLYYVQANATAAPTPTPNATAAPTPTPAPPPTASPTQAPATSWFVHQGRHCGGESILAWSDGKRSRYGKGYVNDLDGCMATCRAHSECAGFVYRAEDDKCSFWQSGPLAPHTRDGHTCYEKKEEAPATSWLVHPGQHCGGTSILVWSNGKGSRYGGGYVNDLDGCKQVCRAHSECAGFVYRAADKRCSFWKVGPLAPYALAGRTCYEKTVEAPTTSWFVHQGQHCGGKSLLEWRNGTSSKYGSGYIGDLDGCKRTCCSQFECVGFVYRAMDDICSFWQSAPLELRALPGHTCYQKNREAPTTSWLLREGQHCGGTSIHFWSKGGWSSYGSGYYDLDGCKEVCRVHTECAGFVYRAADKICSFWKSGPLAPHTRAGYTCYEKKKEDLANFGPYAAPPPRRLQLPATAASTDDTNPPA